MIILGLIIAFPIAVIWCVGYIIADFKGWTDPRGRRYHR